MSTATSQSAAKAPGTTVNNPPAPLATSNEKGTETPAPTSKFYHAGVDACKRYVFSQTDITNAEKALEGARLKAGNTRAAIIAEYAKLAQDDRVHFLAGADKYRTELVDDKLRKQAGDFLSYLRRVDFNLSGEKPNFTGESIAALFQGEGKFNEKMEKLANRINRKKPAPKAPPVKPDTLASAPLVTDTAPKKHAQAAALSDRDISDFFDKVHKNQLGIVMYHLMARAKECGDNDMCEALQIAINKLNVE